MKVFDKQFSRGIAVRYRVSELAILLHVRWHVWMFHFDLKKNTDLCILGCFFSLMFGGFENSRRSRSFFCLAKLGEEVFNMSKALDFKDVFTIK